MKKVILAISISIICVVAFIAMNISLKPMEIHTNEYNIADIKKIGKMQSIGEFNIRVDNPMEYTERDVAEIITPEHVTVFSIYAKNNSETEKGIGSLNFTAINFSGERVEMYAYAETIGEIVNANQSVEGKIYFSAPISSIDAIIYTDDISGISTAWKIV